jgi:hypothetical protein
MMLGIGNQELSIWNFNKISPTVLELSDDSTEIIYWLKDHKDYIKIALK